MNRMKEFAKFACGFEAFHALIHAYFWMSGMTMHLAGIKSTPTWNLVAVFINGIVAITLGLYAWRQPSTSLR